MTFEPILEARPGFASQTKAFGRSWAGRLIIGLAGFAATVAVTFLGLLAITFFIGRVVPIDPVLAVVGDRARRMRFTRLRGLQWGSTSR